MESMCSVRPSPSPTAPHHAQLLKAAVAQEGPQTLNPKISKRRRYGTSLAANTQKYLLHSLERFPYLKQNRAMGAEAPVFLQPSLFPPTA